jgi:long-chain acyl-CoA synthetase
MSYEFEYPSLAALFLSRARTYGAKTLYRFARADQWHSLTWHEAAARVREIGLGLVSVGVAQGDRVAIYADNCVEWNLVDWANICIGALTVPIYSSSAHAQALHIIEHSDPSVLVIDSTKRLERLWSATFRLNGVKTIVLMDKDQVGGAVKPPIPTFSLEALGELGASAATSPKGVFEERAAALRPEDDLTIIYTSGTTGEPKGVLTTHRHYLFMLHTLDRALASTNRDTTLHFLPSAHSLGRLEHFMAIYKGWTLAYARSLEALGKDLRIIKPTILFSVPRIYEIAYRRARARMARSGGLLRLVFRRSLSLGRSRSRQLQGGTKIAPLTAVGTALLNRIVFFPVRRAFGGKVRVAISGGASLSAEVAEFFCAAGMLILEGYGLTETATVSHVNRPDRFKFGTVGLPLEGVECAIMADGEILLRGPNIFKGYLRDRLATQAAVDAEGWFHTEDIGEVDADGFLRITDRKKDLIVLSGGKKVAPQKLEHCLKNEPFIREAMIVGGGQRHLMALITLDQQQVRDSAKKQGISFAGVEEMASHPWVVSRIKDSLQAMNETLAPYEAVRRFSILTHEFTIMDGELTPTLKLKRTVIMQRYQELIDQMDRGAREEFKKGRIHELGV